MASQAVGNAGKRQDLVIRLSFSTCVVACIALLLALSTTWLILRGVETHFVTASGVGYSRPGQMSDAFVLGRAGDIAAHRYTWSYVDFDHALQRFKEDLHPEQLQAFDREVGPKEKQLIQERQMVSGIVVLGGRIAVRDGHKRQVVLQAVRHLWTGATLRLDDLTITMVLTPLIEQGAPTALRVWSLTDDVPLRGQK